MAISAEFGILPTMPWYVRRSWLIQAMADVQTEGIIIDDAQDLNLAHLAFLKEVTDNLAAPPHARQLGLCLVTAHSGKIIALKEIFSQPDILWRQFRRRLDTERPFCVVQGHTEEEVRSILIAFEDIYRSQFPDLQLGRWTKPIFSWLTHATLDPDGSKRVTMDHLTRLVTSALRQSYEQGATDVTAQALQATAELMTLRRDESITSPHFRSGGKGMRDIHIADPAWRTTFPHLVAPLPHEWLAGVLLRCDERNCWGSGTTLGHV
jgi:hypothetical protein